MIKRNIFNTLQDELKRPETLILLGPRQVGKTTLLHALCDYASMNGHKTAFYDLEQPQVLADFNLPDKDIIKILSESGDIVFIDEFQYLKNISKILKAIFDAKLKIKIVCSGSSALEIHKHLKESLAGRKLTYRIYPLEYAEIKSQNESYTLNDYCKYGGMPSIINEGSEQRKQLILNDLLASYILKDIKALIKEENIRAFNHLIYLLAENQGSVISNQSLARDVGLSPKAIGRYLDILEQTYVNYRICSFSKNLGNELKKSCKTYLYDLGMRNMLLKDFSDFHVREDKGIVLETLVLLKLQTILKPNMEVKFWRTKDGGEVDFILLVDRQPIPIEVKNKINSKEVPAGLKRFLTRYPKVKSAYIINENIEETMIYSNCNLNFLKYENFIQNFSI